VASFRLAKKFIALDMGGHSLKLAEVQQVGEKVVLLRYGIQRLPLGKGPEGKLDEEELASLIRKGLKDMKAGAAKGACEVGGPWTVTRHLIVPDLADEEMREGIRWGFRGEFPFALDDALIDFFKLDTFKNAEGEREAEIIAAVATREVVERQVERLKRCGLKPSFISLPAFSLMQAYRFTQPPPWAETVVLIDLGHKSSKIAILKEGKVKFFREVAVAGDFFTQALVGTHEGHQGQVEVDEAKAERIKVQVGLVEEGTPNRWVEGIPLELVQRRLGSVADRLLLEVERSLNYYKNQFKDYNIHRILLTGGGSQLKGIFRYLEQGLEIPVQPWDGMGPLILKKKIDRDRFQASLPFMINLIGLVSQSRPWIDFAPLLVRPQAEKVSRTKRIKAAAIALLPLGAAAFFGSQYVWVAREGDRLQRDLRAKTEQMARIKQAMAELSHLEREEAELDAFWGRYPKIRIADPSLLKGFLGELTTMVPASVMLTRLRIAKVQETPPAEAEETKGSPVADAEDPSKIPTRAVSAPLSPEFAVEIHGTVFVEDAEVLKVLSDFISNLKGSGLLKEVKIRSTKQNETYSKNAADFVLEAKLREKGTGGPTDQGKTQDEKKSVSINR
jgi:type IV pilus assembly protein PilM